MNSNITPIDAKYQMQHEKVKPYCSLYHDNYTKIDSTQYHDNYILRTIPSTLYQYLGPNLPNENALKLVLNSN